MGDSSKYDFDIGDNPTGTHKLILDHVPEYSKVLECGCASGYMTKYMNQKLHCDVDIVEIDKECFKKATQHSRFSYCGDLENDDWNNCYGPWFSGGCLLLNKIFCFRKEYGKGTY